MNGPLTGKWHERRCILEAITLFMPNKRRMKQEKRGGDNTHDFEGKFISPTQNHVVSFFHRE
jgi:hypothetical protein